MLVVHVFSRCRPAGQAVVLQDQSGVAVDQHDLVRPREGDVAVREDVEIRVADPAARGVQVVEVGAPELLAGRRIGLGDEGPDHVRVVERRVLAADDVELARPAVVDVGDAGVVVGAAPGVDLIRSVERSGEGRAGKEPAALAVGDLRAVERRVVARCRDLLLAGQLLGVQADFTRQRAVCRDLVRCQTDLGDLPLDLGPDRRCPPGGRRPPPAPRGSQDRSI